jgi:hypothetical protein
LYSASTLITSSTLRNGRARTNGPSYARTIPVKVCTPLRENVARNLFAHRLRRSSTAGTPIVEPPGM